MRNWFNIFIVLSAVCRDGEGQGFVDLNFESANIPASTPAGTFIPITNAMPGWTGYFENSSVTSVLYDSLATGLQNLSLLSTNNGAIPGNAFTAVIQGGIEFSASISQTAQVPATAESIVFTANIPNPTTAGWQVSLGGQVIPVTQISTFDTYYGVYTGNVSAFAGQLEPLEFTAPPTINLYLDSISFSSSQVPEPGALCLSALGGLLLAWRRWRKPLKT